MIVCEFNIKPNKQKPYTVKYRQTKYINLDMFNKDLQAIQWSSFSSIDNVNEMVNVFNHSVLALFDLHAPVRTVTIKEHSYPWITDTVKLMMSLRDIALDEYRKTGLDSKKQYYKSLKTTVNQAIFNEKSAYFKYNINNQIHNAKN